MAEINSKCPHCGQAVVVDDQFCGQPLQCPACQQVFTAPPKPDNPLVPKPPAGGTRLSTKQQAQAPAVAGRNIPIRNLAPEIKKKRPPLVTALIYIVVIAALGVGGYYGYGWVSERQEKINAASRKAEANSDGGQVGHIADLNQVLDATEPGKMGQPRGRATGPRKRDSGVGQEIPAGTEGAPAPSGDKPAAPTPPTYTLELAKATLPETPVNGKLAGAIFLPETTRIDRVGTAQVLHFVQGQLVSPDRDVLIYLHLRAGETNVNISSDMKGSVVPQVHKRWKASPQAPLQSKVIFNGYAMKLQLGQATNGMIPGKIFLALPDNEQSVLAGTFDALTPQADPNAQPMAAPVATPSAIERDPAFQKRYGLQRR